MVAARSDTNKPRVGRRLLAGRTEAGGPPRSPYRRPAAHKSPAWLTDESNSH